MASNNYFEGELERSRSFGTQLCYYTCRPPLSSAPPPSFNCPHSGASYMSGAVMGGAYGMLQGARAASKLKMVTASACSLHCHVLTRMRLCLMPLQSSQKMRLNQVFNGIGRYSPVWAGNLARRRCLQVTRPSHRLPPASLTRALPRCTSGFLTYNFHGIHLFCTARSLVLAALTVHALSAEIAEHLFLMLAGVEIAGLEMRALSDDRARAQVRFPLRIWFIPAHL